MNTNTINRFTPLTFSNGKTIRNRVVVPPMASQTADEEGFVTPHTLSHYSRLAQAKPGLLIAEYSCIHISGRSEERQLGIQSDEHIAGLSLLANRIQRSGALAGIQITHAGGKTERRFTDGKLMAPSAIAVPVKDRQLECPDSMSAVEIGLWKTAFAAAVDRAVQAGFDVVEFHAAHGYGLNQWLSGITNQRSDSYGGGVLARLRLVLEIAKDARDRHPNLFLSARIPGQDFIAGGLQIEDAIVIAQALETAGVDMIHVSSGIGGWRRPSERNGEGYLVIEASRIQAAVRVPVIGVGGIETATFIDESLRAGRFSMAAVGRAILKDPVAWQAENLAFLRAEHASAPGATTLTSRV